MAVTQLATSTDVVAAMGRSLTASESARVGAILDKASELFRRRSGQTFTAGTSTVRLKVNGGRVYLTQVPVTAVTTVLDDDAVAVTYARAGQWLTIDEGSTSCNSSSFVTVTYTHGGTVPDLVRLAIADLARRVLLIPEAAAAGSTQHSETAGPFTTADTYGRDAIGGTVSLSDEDKALADSYKFRVPTVHVMVAS